MSLWLIFFISDSNAFVSSIDANGHMRRWHVESPGADVPTNSFNRATESIRFFLPTFTASAGAEEAERNAIRAAFGQWQAVPGAAIRFEEGGALISNPDINTGDHTNIVYFSKTEVVNGGRDSIFNRGIAITYFNVNAANELLEADIVVNNFQFQWFSDYFDTANTGYFIESTILHEIGHWLGLDHSPAGGATMFARSLRGLNPEIGLAADDVAAARALYPKSLGGSLTGLALIDGSPLFGAVVTLEDAHGNLLQSTVTRNDGRYRLEALPAGSGQVRVTPLDPAAGISLTRLITGPDISPDYSGAITSFKPTENFPVAIQVGSTQTQNFNLTTASPAFRITRIIPPAAAISTAINAPAQIAPGASGLIIGVAGPALPTNNATLEISGSGVTLGTTLFNPDPFGTAPPLHTIYASINVDANAAPGLRTLIVRSGGDVAYANGFLEITPSFPDDNFDGLDDRFQRKYFPLFTSADAAPTADPDFDAVSNADEFAAGTNPTSSASLLRVEQIQYNTEGARVRWQSVAGKRYQLWSRDDIEGAPWLATGPAVVASGSVTEQMDASARSERYYRVAVLP